MKSLHSEMEHPALRMTLATAHYPAARLHDLAAIRELVETAAVVAGGDPDAVGELVLAVNEAACNIITHGYQDEPGGLEVVVEQEGRDLLVRLRDGAPPFNPTTVATPDTQRPLDQRPPGGMGVHMMRQFTDDIVYRQTAEGANELVMVKRDVL
jgi:serine/threonine-protein kinase RsbW